MLSASFLQNLLSVRLQTDPDRLSLHTVGGGSINQCFRLQAADGPVFCKANSAVNFPQLFLKEKQGLECLANTQLIRTPVVRDHFEAEGLQVLLLEWIAEGERTEAFWQRLGQQLAALHQFSSEQYGWETSNYMGSVVQRNERLSDWPSFFRQQRLEPLVELCYREKRIDSQQLKRFDNLYLKLSSVFDPDEKPVLVHGDLWSGNFMCDAESHPVLIDPAVHFGHRSADLGMTTLFGGFRPAFYEAYHYHHPFPSNYREQWEICNLYPLLIHLYLFGTGYLPQILRTLQQFA
ncbi:MAG TPA: fructosamine kinase family protein [Flavisolibacter sp.]|nr:fructosamine kinase family protein [Flavisolibacter sp.]